MKTDQQKQPGVVTPVVPSPLSPFAEKMLTAMRRLTKERVPHPHGGFTTDDMEWQMGTAFTPQETLDSAIDELQSAKLIRWASYDEQDAIGMCYELQ